MNEDCGSGGGAKEGRRKLVRAFPSGTDGDSC